jgi:hypothetical protein
MAERRRNDAVDAARQARQQQAVNAPPSAHESRKQQGKEDRRAQRDAVRAVEEAERAVTAAEAEVGRIAHALEAPELYDGSAKGAEQAQRLGAELAAARAKLEKAEERWAEASERAEALGVL